MRLFEIINEITFENLDKTFMKSTYKYKEYKKNYEKMFFELQTRTPKLDDEFQIVISEEFDDFEENNEIYFYAHAYNLKEKQYYGLMLTSWNEWLGMTISTETIVKYTSEEIVMHCLNEMSYFGFSEDFLTKETEKLNRSIKSLEDGTAKLITMDELKSKK